MTPFDPVRIAVVGLGYWGPNLVRNLFELPAAEIGLVCDLRAEALGKIERRYPSVRGTRSFQDVLEDSSIEAVVIATPIGTHFDRFLVPAGITGLWQVTARAHATFREALDMDVAYARGWSLGLDLRLLVRTPLQILSRKATA